MYGYINMATSSRKLLTNYFDFAQRYKKNNMYLMHEKVTDKDYPIVEENDETLFYSSEILNGVMNLPELVKNDIDYIILNDYMIDENDFYNVTEAFCSLLNAIDDNEFLEKIKDVIDFNSKKETTDGFFNKKTVYKVKDYEK